MALTPEEVINKRFQPTKFKEGYNPEEVDDFLDEIVIELRRLNAENAGLKRQLEEAEAKAAAAPAESPAPAAPATPAPAPVASPVKEEEPQSTSSATGLLAMAQKVHDDYVFEGKRERERLITEGREEAAKLVADAKEESNNLLGDLQKSKSELEVSVAKLRSFEKNYRSSLRDYLNKQLTNLDDTSSLEPEAELAPTQSPATPLAAPGQAKSGVFSQK